MRSATIRGRGVAATTALSVFVAVLAVGWSIAARTEWQARATAVLEPAPALDVSLRSYAYDLMTRDVVKSTYEAIIGNVRFQHEAAEALGLPDSIHEAVRIEVNAAARDATITLTATSPEPGLAEQMVHATLDSARSYVDPLTELFVLRVTPPVARASSRRHLQWSSPAALGLLVGASGVALVAYAGTRIGLSRNHRAFRFPAVGRRNRLPALHLLRRGRWR